MHSSRNDSGNGGGAYSYRNGLSTLPSVDSVSEFKIDSNNQKAEFEGSASVTIVSKTGTNNFHGSIFEFNRSKALAAKNAALPSSVPNPPFNRNEFGFTLGGPIIREKTFFYGSYEGLRERFSRTNTLSVGTPAMRNGDFAGLPAIIDPLTSQPFASGQHFRTLHRRAHIRIWRPPPDPIWIEGAVLESDGRDSTLEWLRVMDFAVWESASALLFLVRGSAESPLGTSPFAR